MGATGAVALPLAMYAVNRMGSSGGKGGSSSGSAQVPTALLPIIRALTPVAQAGAQNLTLGGGYNTSAPGYASGIEGALLSALGPAITGMSGAQLLPYMPQNNTSPLLAPGAATANSTPGTGNTMQDMAGNYTWGMTPQNASVAQSQLGMVEPGSIGDNPRPASSALGATGATGTAPAAGSKGGTPAFPNYTSNVSGGIPGLFNTGMQGVQQGAQTGFLPSMDAISQALAPAMVGIPGNLGAAQIRENAALTGNTSSTGALNDVTQLYSNLGAGLQQQVGNIYGQALPTSMGIQSGMANTAFNSPGSILSMLQPYSSQGIQQSQYQQTLPLSYLSAASGGATQLPFYQPSYGPGKGQQLMGAGTQLGSAYLAGGGAGGK